MQKINVLRWGHRVQRDVRLTTHVALTSRALGASGFILSDTTDERIKTTVEKITRNWGGNFSFDMGKPWRTTVNEWKAQDGLVVHLTVYGENIQTSDVLSEIRKSGKNILLLIGSQKVPREFYSAEISDYNVSIGNQPHSECAAVAVFLDRFFEGKPLAETFKDAKIRVMPRKRGKKTIVNHGFQA